MRCLRMIAANCSAGRLFALIAAVVLGVGPVLAIPETNYASDYARLVMPYYATGISGEFNGERGVTISYRVFDRGAYTPAIVILPGRSEPYRKYAELIYDLGSRGYSIYVLDHRGQGASERLTPLHDVGYVDNFNDYVADVETFMNSVVLPRKHARLFLLAQSMGGTIGVLYIAKHPTAFNAVVLSSPTFEINTRGVSETYAYLGSLWKVLTGEARSPVDGPDHYQYDPTLTVDQSEVTSSTARWNMYREIIHDDPQLALGSVSYGWLYAVLAAMSKIEQLGRTIRVPVLVFRAGQDQLQNTASYDSYCWYRPKLCSVVSAPFKDAQHEILQERDEIRDRALYLIGEQFR